MELAGRSAIVTGGSLGLGRAIAIRFLQEGASVLLAARDEAVLRRTREELRPLAVHPGQVIEAVPGDVSQAESCEAIVGAARAMLPDITILVNNAGVHGPIGRIEEVDWDHWVRAVQINLFGTVLMCRATIPLMRARGYGKIINLFGTVLMCRATIPLMRARGYGKIINLSGGGATAPRPRFSAYGAAKAAVVRLTETLAEEVRGARVDVNAIAPGALNTRLLEGVLAAGPERVGEAFYSKSIRQREEGGVPLEKGAALATFLASAASDGITGRLLSAVWDDWTRLPERRGALEKSDVYTLRRIVPEDRRLEW
jgi:3-oxoacyl-[acyl-carrier protein] reductase